MNWTMPLMQVTVAAVTASQPASQPAMSGFLKGITREYYLRILQSLALPAVQFPAYSSSHEYLANTSRL